MVTGNSYQYGEHEYDCNSEESEPESDSTISTMKETVPVLSRMAPGTRSSCKYKTSKLEIFHISLSYFRAHYCDYKVSYEFL